MGHLASTNRGQLTVANTRIYWLHALTPLHVGTGQGTGFIDLPIMREKTTRWPLVPGSSVKGVLADYYQASAEERGKNASLRAAFGRADHSEADKDNAGSLVFTDARMVCLAVRSLFGTFAWVSSPLALRRFQRDLAAAGIAGLPGHCPVSESQIHLPAGVASALEMDQNVYLEDLDFQAAPCACAGQWAAELAAWVFPGDADWQALFKARFAILPDNSFDYLCEMGTEVNARIRIDEETQTVAPGALWYEESLPAESILAGLVWCDRVFSSDKTLTPGKLLDAYCAAPRAVQIGGKASVGKGRARCVFTADGGRPDAHP